MMLTELLKKNRSYRRFVESDRIPQEQLCGWIGALRYCPSGRNIQPLRYAAVTDPDACAALFEGLSWAGYLPDWPGPEPGERPAAYAVQMLDTRITPNCLCDDGIQVQSLMLLATEAGYGGCIIKAFREELVRQVLQIPEQYKILYVMALGRPAEQVVIDSLAGDEVKYWRDEAGVHHVPKRAGAELIVIKR